MERSELIAKILGVDRASLEAMDKVMREKTGRTGVIENLCDEDKKIIESVLDILNSQDETSASHVRSILRKTIYMHEGYLLKYLSSIKGKNEFERAANLARKIARVERGFFLKKDRAEEILKKHRPENLLQYLKLKSVEEAIKKYDVTEIFSALRFVESDEWMHQTFDKAYSQFTPDDFEERNIEIKVLGPEWHEVSQKFVAKKHHNVSHLKEFGIVFLNPIRENIPGKFLRDFALFFHYFHEVEFYSKLFRKYSESDNFAEKLKMLLRGDIPEIYKAEPGEWLIIQRYLFKENPNDPRLFIPHVNPESMHWARGERDLTTFKSNEPRFDIGIWYNLDWIGAIFQDGDDEVVSFDLEDNAMSLAAFMEGKEESFNYHQQEALWSKLFSEYVGGEEEMERLLIENFDKGIIKF